MEQKKRLDQCCSYDIIVIHIRTQSSGTKSITTLAIHRDASYLSDPKSRSQSVRQLLLTNKPKQGQHIMKNLAVHVVSTIIRNVMPSAAEAEVADLYLNAKYCVIVWNTLEELVHPQPEISLQTNNYTSEGIINIYIV